MKEKIIKCASFMLVMALAFSPAAMAQHDHMHDDHPVPEGASIGDIDFRVNCSEEVQADFDRALGMLHHMMYVIARESFEKIAEADPNCAMAYWGVATTLFQPIWGTRPSDEDLQFGWETINKALELVESKRKELLVKSTADFFREPETADFRTRIDRWVNGVEEAYEAYSNDADIAAFYALSRMTIAQFVDDRGPLYDQAEMILRDIFEQVPTHPGAVHYTIHATDVDGRAENALDVVAAYAEIAPEVPHALHMPSHIYVRLGDWPEVIDWNRKSAKAALNHPVRGAVSHHYIHAIDYLVYAYLQRGQDQKAENAYTKVLRKDRHQASFVSAFHFAAIPARLAVEQRDWVRAANLEPRTPDYLPWDASPWAEGLTWYARGLGAVHTGDLDGARKANQRLIELRGIAENRGDDNMAAYIETERRVLEGRIAFAEGDEQKAVDIIRSAAKLEASVEKHPVTPGALQPPWEALGDLYMDLNQPEEALAAYETSDNIWPGRLNTLMGAALAAKMAGNEQLARTFFGKLINGAEAVDGEPISDVHE
ncbi:MAG: tetratricopeptide repeat protein [Balneolaceae bacterium]